MLGHVGQWLCWWMAHQPIQSPTSNHGQRWCFHAYWEFTVPWLWSSGHRFNHLMDLSSDWRVLRCSWRVLMEQTLLRRSQLEDPMKRCNLEIFFFLLFFYLCLVCHQCVLVHFWYSSRFIGVRMCTSDNGRLRPMIVFDCNFHRSQDHYRRSFFESQNRD
jgi:hypothetical protein